MAAYTSFSTLTVFRNLVTVPFHQIVRATTPAFTVFICRLRFGEVYSKTTYLSLVPVIVGVGLATYGDYYFTVSGFMLTVLGALAAAIKTIVTNRVQMGQLRLSALEILSRIGPLAFLQSMLLAWAFGEFSLLQKDIASNRSNGQPFSPLTIVLVLVNALVSFGLNIVSFTANRASGALTMTVAANIKQILIILLSIIFFDLEVGVLHAVGE